MNLITDRTPNDVERWRALRDKGWDRMTEEERREWLGEIDVTPSAAKGMYTHNDLNRVESAVAEIVERLVKLGHRDLKLEVKTDWSYTDDFWQADMVRYLKNVSELASRVVNYPTTPPVPEIRNKLDYIAANDIEKILVDVSDITLKNIDTRCYAGEIFLGEV